MTMQEQERSSSKWRKLRGGMIMMIMVVAMTSGGVEALSMGHSHHMKRQQPNVPQLTLSIEPTHGVEPSPHPHPPTHVPDYHFPVDSGLFNFTCTIKHPQHRYKLSIAREVTKLNGAKIITDFIDPTDYIKHTNLDGDERISVDYAEPNYDPSAQYIRVSLLIRHLKIEDNGVYVCKYGNLFKKINAIVYRVATTNDVSMYMEGSEQARLNTVASLTCRVSNVYPKPRIVLMHSLRESIQNSVVERDVSIVEDEFNPHRLYTLTATYNFTPSYSDNNQKITCTVISQGTSNASITESYQLKVEGTQIIDKDCPRGVVYKQDENDFKITCVFFSNPRFEGNSYWETTEEAEASSVSASASSGGNTNNINEAAAAVDHASSGGETSQSHDEQHDSTTSATLANVLGDKLVRIFENDDSGHYAYSLEDYHVGDESSSSSASPSSPTHSGLYRAVLKFKSVRPSDLKKNFTFRADEQTRTINLFENEKQKDALLKENGSVSALVKSHSIVFILNLILVALVFIGF